MASGWQSKLARVSQMSWDEIRTRLSQEAAKRTDALLYGRGKRKPWVNIGSPSPRRGAFFFSSTEITERIELIRTHLPHEAAAALREADEICQHRFRLLGYENLDYGAEIDWHLDRVHGKRAPLVPWPRVPFLEFAAVGDHKVIWELNRHQHLVTLAKAWLLTHDQKYLRELRAQWQRWIQANPYPLGINWASTLEVAFRALSWIWVDQLLAGAPGHDEFHAQLVPELAWHGRYIERFLSTYFSPNTHLLGEAVVLLFIATTYPEISVSARWQRAAWDVILRESTRQVRPDGVYFEQSLHYDVYALDFFLHARLLAERNGSQVSAEFDSTLNRMLDVVQALSQAGPPEGFGDDDGGRVFNPRRNQTEHMTDPLAIGAVLYQRNDLSAARLTEEAIWLFGSQAALALSEAKPSSPRCAAFPDGGLYILADSEGSHQQLVVDAGPQGVGRCGHGHADALSVRLAIEGRRWLIDSGTGVYISADHADRNVLRGTAAHNTMRVDGVDQAVPADPFSWTDIPNTRVENWEAGETFSYFAGSHDGYARLTDPVIHSRQIVKINGGPLLIRDVAQGRHEHELELFWHFAPGTNLEQNTGGEQTSLRVSSASQDRALHLIVPDQTQWKVDGTRSVISPAYGQFCVAPMLRAHARIALPAELAAVLSIESAPGRELARLAGTRGTAVQVYELADGSTIQGFCFALDKRPWDFGPWFSDAEFLYYRTEQQRLVHLIMVGGTSISWQKQSLLKTAAPCDLFEWRKQGEIVHSRPGTVTLSSRFHQMTGSGHIAGEMQNAASSIGGEKH